MRTQCNVMLSPHNAGCCLLSTLLLCVRSHHHWYIVSLYHITQSGPGKVTMTLDNRLSVQPENNCQEMLALWWTECDCMSCSACVSVTNQDPNHFHLWAVSMSEWCPSLSLSPPMTKWLSPCQPDSSLPAAIIVLMRHHHSRKDSLKLILYSRAIILQFCQMINAPIINNRSSTPPPYFWFHSLDIDIYQRRYRQCSVCTVWSRGLDQLKPIELDNFLINTLTKHIAVHYKVLEKQSSVNSKYAKTLL